MATQSSSAGAPARGAAPGRRWPLPAFIRNLSIGGKLTLGFGLLVLLTLGVVGLSYLGSVPATQIINRTNNLRVPTALTSARAQADLLRMLGDVRGYLALGDAEYRLSYQQSAKAFAADLADLEKLSANFDDRNKGRLAQLKTALYQWSQLPDPLFALRDDQLDREPAYRLLATDGSKLAGTVLIDLNALIDAQSQREATADNIQALGEMAKVQGSFAAMFSAARGYATTRNRIYRQEYEVNASANQFAWDTLAQRRARLTASQQATLDEVAKNRTAFEDLVPNQVFVLLEGEHSREDLYLFRTQAVPLANTMQDLLSQMTSEQQLLLAVELANGTARLALANQQTLLGGVVAVALAALMAFVFSANIGGPVRRLTRVAEQIRGGDLQTQAEVESNDEVGTLAGTFNRMTAQLRQTLTQVRFEKKRADDLLEVVIPIGVELASEKDFNRLLENMLAEAKTFCNAAAGVLYLVTDDQHLQFVIFHDDRQGLKLGGTTGKEIPFGRVPLRTAGGAPNDRNLAVHTALTLAPVNIAEARRATDFDFALPPSAGAGVDLSATAWLSLPLKNREHKALGVLQLLDPRDRETGQVVAFDANLERMMASFSSLAVAALEAYIREQRLRQEIQQLRIEIDEVKRRKQVAEIVESDSFKEIQEKARAMRRRRMEEESRQAGAAGGGQGA